jgi:hypothetical protein
MREGRATLVCPNCKRQLTITRPDSMHPIHSLNKPREIEIECDVIEQIHDCKNPYCKAKVTVYWYETKLFIDRG